MSVQQVRFSLESEEHTESFAKRLASVLRAGDFVGLQGDLGVGKTALARAMLREWGVQGEINSPTFVLECLYRTAGNMTVSHWDLYRWSTEALPDDLLDYRQQKDRVVLVEWPEKSSSLLDLLDLRIMLDFADFPARGQSPNLGTGNLGTGNLGTGKAEISSARTCTLIDCSNNSRFSSFIDELESV